MRARILKIAATLLVILAPAPARALDSVWDKLPPGVSTDSLAPALRRIESGGPRSTAAGAAYALGLYHHARGEYHLAADAFGRAAARLNGFDRSDARYRQGLSWLGAGDGGRARAAFEAVSEESRPFRPLAQLGLAQALGLLGESEHEMDVLRRLLDGPAGEAEPAALERYALLCDRIHHTADAIAARDRLLRRWPRSLEAARLAQAPPGLVQP